MAWSTLYITGKKGFQDEVAENLRESDISYLPGSSGESNLIMIWVDDTLPLRDLKIAIGSKTVFRYRLRFFSTPEEHHASESQEKLTAREQAMIREMSDWEARYLHSA